MASKDDIRKDVEEVDRFLASQDGLPRTFTFDRINFELVTLKR